MSNKLGQIATIGLNAFAHGDDERGRGSRGRDLVARIQHDVVDLVRRARQRLLEPVDATYNTGSYALALTAYGENWPLNSGASQQMIVGLTSGVPETSTWAMMGIGFLGLTFAGFRQRKDRLATI